MFQDTIVAIATAMQDSAISVIRLSGSDAVKITSNIFKGKDLQKAQTHTINYGHIHDSGQVVDEVLVSIMRGPRSFTVEDVVEINCHGGIFVTNKVLELTLIHGARLAEPGEFSKRAFLNGRIDLAQAESIIDIIHSNNEKALSLAVSGLDGKISKLIRALRENILDIVANIEVNIDYPEYDDIEVLTDKKLLPKCHQIYENMLKIFATAKTGKILKEGIQTAIIGRPNVGKSSLLNALMREEKAIVTDIAGTTRDVVEGQVNVGGLVLNLVDTAGIRETDDVVESIGVKKSRELIEQVELLLLVLNGNEGLTDEDKDLLRLTGHKKRIILVNKSDLTSNLDKSEIAEFIEVSALEDRGMDLLTTKIKDMFEMGEINSKDLTYLSNARHIVKLKEAMDSVESAIKNMKMGLPIDMIELDIKNSWHTLGEIIGEEVTDSLIDELFTKFCLGK